MEPRNDLAKMLLDSVGQKNLDREIVTLFEENTPVEKVIIPPKIISEIQNDLFLKCGKEIQEYRQWAAESYVKAHTSPVNLY